MKVITYDIEVSPRKAYIYGSNWEPKFVREIEGQKLLSFAWKELGKKKTHVIANQPTKVMLKEIWSVLNDSDICIGHNLQKFDKRMMNAYFITNGMSPPAPSHVIDTLKIARKEFAFPSNRLDDLATYLGLKGKTKETHADLWEDCLAGDATAWRKMAAYNKQDVVLTEQVYKILAPWTENLASVATEEGQCPNCGSHRLVKRGTRKNKPGTQEYQRYLCKECNHWSSSKKGIKTEVTIK